MVPRGGLPALQLYLYYLLEAMFPRTKKLGITDPFLAVVVTHVFMAMGVIRLHRSLQEAKFPRWAARVFRVLPHHARVLIGSLDPQWLSWCRSFLHAQPTAASSVYILWSASGVYVGKANLTRTVSTPGVAARLREHLRGIRFPHHGDGRWPRYQLLRKSLGTLCMLPVAVLKTEAEAFALESLLIKFTNPDCNNSDRGYRNKGTTRGQLLRPRPDQVRRRPPPRLRGPRQAHSIWYSQVFQAAADKLEQERTHHEQQLHHPGQLRGAFTEVYWAIVQIRYVESRMFGPVSIFEEGLFNLFLAYCASYRPCVNFPPSWSRDTIAGFLYGAGRLLNDFISGGARRMAALMFIEYLLRLHKLAPFSVPPLVLPAYLDQHLPRLRRQVFAILQSIRTASVREWLRSHLRIRKGRPDRWVDKVNSKKGVRDFSFEWRHSDPSEIGRACTTGSLRAVTAPWRLPVWHSPATLWRQCSARWADWARRVRLPFRVLRKGKHVWSECRAHAIPAGAPPTEWRQYEARMKASLSPGSFRVGDDRDPSKVWFMNKADLNWGLLKGVLEDPLWTIRGDLTYKMVEIWGYARAQLGLPGFLRRRAGRPGRKLFPPLLFPLVKSKCYSDEGERTCTKEGHSHWRRILDMSGTPYAAGWKTTARGIRAVVQESGVSREIFDINYARKHLQQAFFCLERSENPSVCMCCQGAMEPGLHVVTVDIDQAFESCKASSIVPAWDYVANQYRASVGQERLLIRRGKRFIAKHGTEVRQYGRGWWALSLSVLRRALVMASYQTLVMMGDVALEMAGMAIGGVMSAAAVSVKLGSEEGKARHPHEFPGLPSFRFHGDPQKAVNWSRYVDDLLAGSFILCCSCIFSHLQGVFEEPLSLVFASDGQAEVPFDWIDLSCRVVGDTLQLILKNVNRPWLYSWPAEKKRAKTNVLPWVGTLPTPFGVLRGVLIARLCRARRLQLGRLTTLVHILEYILELFFLGYPKHILRGLVHSLPNYPAVRLARDSLRSWFRALADSQHTKCDLMGDGGKGRGKDHFRGGPGRGYDQRPGERDRDRDNQYQRDRRDRDRDRDRNRDRRRRPASSTSSESRGDQEAKRLERHRRWMYEKDPTYKAYVDQVESDLRDAEVRRQGEIRARALQDSLDRAFKENKLMPIPSTGKASFPPSTPPGGKASAPADHPAGSNGTATPPRAPASDGGLTETKKLLVETQFENILVLTDGTEATFKEAISAAWGNRKVSQTISKLFKKKSLDEPKRKDEKIAALWKFYLDLD